jgi:hypothetical protein
MQTVYGKVQKVNTVVPSEIKEYTTMNDCHICNRKIPQVYSHIFVQPSDSSFTSAYFCRSSACSDVPLGMIVALISTSGVWPNEHCESKINSIST